MRNNACRRAVTVHRVKWADVHFSVVRGCSVVLCRGALAAMQRRDSSPLELDFLIQNRCYYVSELVFVDFLGLD